MAEARWILVNRSKDQADIQGMRTVPQSQRNPWSCIRRPPFDARQLTNVRTEGHGSMSINLDVNEPDI